jgi:hypothetical protein
MTIAPPLAQPFDEPIGQAVATTARRSEPPVAPPGLERPAGPQIESRGVDTVPEAERTAKPRDVVAILLGANMAFSVVVFGWLPVAYGSASGPASRPSSPAPWSAPRW